MFREHVIGLDVEMLDAEPWRVYQILTADSQLRWLGPERGVIRMALGPVVNATWDPVARRAGKPLWECLLDLTPEEVVAAADLTYLRDVLSDDEALDILIPNRSEVEDRRARIRERGVPADASIPSWLGYDDPF